MRRSSPSLSETFGPPPPRGVRSPQLLTCIRLCCSYLVFYGAFVRVYRNNKAVRQPLWALFLSRQLLPDAFGVFFYFQISRLSLPLSEGERCVWEGVNVLFAATTFKSVIRILSATWNNHLLCFASWDSKMPIRFYFIFWFTFADRSKCSVIKKEWQTEC